MEMQSSVYTDILLNEKRLTADPAADQLVKDLVIQKGEFASTKLFDRLTRNIGLPLDFLPRLVNEFIEQNSSLPDWADPVKINQAHELFIDHGPKFLIFLYYKSLPMLYACANGAQVLVQTGRLAHQQSTEKFTRRIAETGQFLIDVMAPGSLFDSKKGIEAAVKVRLVHASIRSFIPSKYWDENKLGKPINQEDLLMTLMTFSVAILDALDQFGLEESDHRKESYFHFWLVIGFLMGIDEDFLPKNLSEGRKVMNKILERQAAPSPQGKILTEALLKFGNMHFHEGILKDVPQVLMRFMIGEQLSNTLAVSQPSGCAGIWLPSFLKKAFGFIEKLEDRGESLQRIIDELSKVAAQHLINYFNNYKNRPFEVPDELKRNWF